MEITVLKKIFPSYTTDGGLTSLKKSKIKHQTPNHPANKWTNELNSQFWEETQIASKYLKTPSSLSYQGNAETDSYPGQKGYHQDMNKDKCQWGQEVGSSNWLLVGIQMEIRMEGSQ